MLVMGPMVEEYTESQQGSGKKAPSKPTRIMNSGADHLSFVPTQLYLGLFEEGEQIERGSLSWVYLAIRFVSAINSVISLIHCKTPFFGGCRPKAELYDEYFYVR